MKSLIEESLLHEIKLQILRYRFEIFENFEIVLVINRQFENPEKSAQVFYLKSPPIICGFKY